jgi:hypothetical protein
MYRHDIPFYHMCHNPRWQQKAALPAVLLQLQL